MLDFSLGWLRICSERAVLEHPSFRGAAAHSHRPVLLRQKHVQEPILRSSSFRDKLREHTWDLHGQTGALCMQRSDALH